MMRILLYRAKAVLFALAITAASCAVLRGQDKPNPAGPASQQSPGLWDLAKAKASVHRFSTLITAQQVRDLLSTEKGIDAAIDWCRKTAVTKVYIEVFRDGYQAERETLEHAKERFQAAGFEVSGCVTTTQVGKRSTGWNEHLLLHRPADAGAAPGDLRVRGRAVRRDHDRRLLVHRLHLPRVRRRPPGQDGRPSARRRTPSPATPGRITAAS